MTPLLCESDIIIWNCILSYSGTSGSSYLQIKRPWWARKRIHYSCEGSIEKSIPHDHRLSSRGLPSDDKRWSLGHMEKFIPPDHRLSSVILGTDFSITLMKDSYITMLNFQLISCFFPLTNGMWHGKTCLLGFWQIETHKSLLSYRD